MAVEIVFKQEIGIGKKKYQFEVKGAKLYDVVKVISFGDIDKCGLCGSDNLYMAAHKAQGKHEYITVKCKHCKATLNLGKQQEDTDINYYKTRKSADGKKSELDWQSMGSQQGGDSGAGAPPNINYQQGQAPQQQWQAPHGQYPQNNQGGYPQNNQGGYPQNNQGGYAPNNQQY